MTYSHDSRDTRRIAWLQSLTRGRLTEASSMMSTMSTVMWVGAAIRVVLVAIATNKLGWETRYLFDLVFAAALVGAGAMLARAGCDIDVAVDALDVVADPPHTV